MERICRVLQGLKPALLMVLVQVAFAAVNVLYKLAANDGMNLKIIVAYRFIFATAFMAPLAFIVERFGLFASLTISQVSSSYSSKYHKIWAFKLMFLIVYNILTTIQKLSNYQCMQENGVFVRFLPVSLSIGGIKLFLFALYDCFLL